MRIRSVTINNLRSVRELTINFDAVTALLGGNNAGKSTILRALEIFFEAAPRLQPDDFHNREDVQIEVTIIFSDLVPAEIAEFGTAVAGDTLTLRRIFSANKEDNLQYEVLAESYPPFAEVRAISGKTERRTKFNELVAATEGLTTATSADAADLKMDEWEAENQEKLELRFRRGFFGATNVANGILKKKTSVHLVPAVADAQQETSDAKKSPIITLLSEISRQIYENRKEVADFILSANNQFSDLVDPTRIPELGGLSELLTASVQRYYQRSSLLAEWKVQDGLTVEFPKPTIRVEDQGFQTTLENVGHGLQRASLFAIIQFLGERALAANADAEFDMAQSDIILLVEEPEIYQHPHKQLVISEAFHSICKGFSASTGIRFQIVFTTHSEKFVGLHKFQSARILRRMDGFAVPSHTANGISLSECSTFFAGLVGRPPMSDEAFEAKMHIFSREVCEGFFAEKVILVEGVTDKAVLEGFYRSKGIHVASEGLAIIAVDGKTKIDKPLYIFSKLGIPTFTVFDGDQSKATKKQNPRANIMIQRVLGITEPVDFPDGVFPNHAVFSCNLESYLKGCVGEDNYNALFAEISEEFGLSQDDLCKTPLAIESVMVEANARFGTEFPYLEQIIKSIDRL